MDQQELARILKEMYDKSARETTAGQAHMKTMVHLFGISPRQGNRGVR